MSKFKRHEWVLCDVFEVYGVEKTYEVFSKPEFIGWNYLLCCCRCGKTRMVQEVTFERMLSMGLVSLYEQQ